MLDLCLAIFGSARIALSASEDLPENLRAALGRDDPGARGPRRIVTNVLVVATFELGHPMLLVILMEADDSSVHVDQYLGARTGISMVFTSLASRKTGGIHICLVSRSSLRRRAPASLPN